MFFVHPLALVGLSVALVPPLLHFFQRREPPRVVFPAVRYLRQTEREAERAIRLRHLLLMVLRMLAVFLVVVAAARPVIPYAAVGVRAPVALALVLDNSLSSGAFAGGTRVLDDLALRARETLRAARDGDALWLIAADGIARRGTPGELLRRVADLGPDARRLDLTEGVQLGARLVESSGYAQGEVHVLSDLQETAVSRESRAASRAGRARSLQPAAASEPGVPVLFYHPAAEPPANRAVVGVRPEPATWLGGRGVVAAVIAGAPAPGGGKVGATVAVAGREGARGLVAPGDAVTLAAVAPGSGWVAGEVRLPPDELRVDDYRPFAVRVAPPPRVAVEAGADLGRFVSEALAVLAERGRVRLDAGAAQVVIGETARSGAVVVVPPSDPVRIGAANRALQSAGAGWRFGPLVDAEDTLVAPLLPGLGGERVRRRYRLERTGETGEQEVLARAGADPWLVRAGGIVVVGSRLVPEETSLPLSGAFVPFVEALAGRLARGEEGIVEAAPGQPVALGDRVGAIQLSADSSVRVEGGAIVSAPSAPGVYPLLAGAETLGVLVVAPDPRESDLRRAGGAALRAAFPGSRIVVTSSAREYGARRFRSAGQSEITAWLLAAALAVLIVEALVAAGASLRRSA